MENVHTVLDAIDRAPLRWESKKSLSSIAYDLAELSTAKSSRLRAIRFKLNNLLDTTTCPHKKAMIGVTISIIKNINIEYAKSAHAEKRDKHMVSDHAFCAYLRRTGTDVSSMKDIMVDKHREDGLVPIMKNGVIATFLKEEYVCTG